MNNFHFSKHPLIAAFLFTFICLLQEMLLRDFTPSNELRYLSIADEALRDGNFFAFFNHGIPYADKPPLYIWIVMLCRLAFGEHSLLVLSLFSIIPAFVTVWLMDRWVMKGTSPGDRVSVAMMLMTSAMFLGTMVVLRMDMLMCMFIVLALFTFWRMYEINSAGESESHTYRKYSWLLPLWIFLALFTKGPVGLLMPPVAIITFLCINRKWRDIGKYLGWKTWGVIIGLCAAWFIGVYADGGKSYLENLLFKQTMGRAVNAFTHSRPFWFYAVAILWCIAPYTILSVGYFGISVFRPWEKSADKKPENIKSGKERFFLCVIVSTFIMLSMFSSKLPIYLVPILPFAIYLIPIVTQRKAVGSWTLWAVVIPAGLLMLTGIAAMILASGNISVPAVVSLMEKYPFIATTPVKIAAVLCFATNAAAIWFIFRNKCLNLPVLLIASSLLLTIYAASGTLGKANAYIGYREICRTVPEGTEVATLFLHRPENIDVYLGREPKNYGDDVNAFLRDASDSTEAVTLITTESGIENNPQLREFVNDSGTAIFVGSYCSVTRKACRQGQENAEE